MSTVTELQNDESASQSSASSIISVHTSTKTGAAHSVQGEAENNRHDTRPKARFLSLLQSVQRDIWHLILLSTTTTLFILTAWFAQTTFTVSGFDAFSTRLRNDLGLGISSTLAILRLLEGLLSLCVATAISKSFEIVQWSLLARNEGLPALLHLGLSPITGLWGTLALISGKKSSGAARLASVARISSVTTVWVAGILLFLRTRLVVVYDSVETYNVSAGVGRFNGSYVAGYLERYQTTNTGYVYNVLPFSIMAMASNLVVNPMHSSSIAPVNCSSGQECQGYLVSGGLMMTTPWPPTDHTSSPVVTIDAVPATQIDFVRGIHNDSFDDAQDCQTFGGAGYLIGVKFCLAQSRSSIGSLFAGLFVCTDGMNNNECWTASRPPEVTTTLSLYSRHASITAARSNLSIIAVNALDTPIQETVLDLDALKVAFSWLLNFTAADVPAPTSIAQYFWTVQDQLGSEYWSVEPYQIFYSILAFPFWQFNPNNFGNTDLDARNVVAGLPSDCYTTASIGNPLDRIAVDRPMFVLFCILYALILALAWLILILRWTSSLPYIATSSYTAFDLATKLVYHRTGLKDKLNEEETTSLGTKGDKSVRKRLKQYTATIRRT